MEYLAKLYYCEAEEDHYKKGCIGGRFDKTYRMEFEAPTLQGVIDKIKEFHNVEDITIEDGYYSFAKMENADGLEPSEAEIRQWESGNAKLWYVETAYKIYKCEEV